MRYWVATYSHSQTTIFEMRMILDPPQLYCVAINLQSYLKYTVVMRSKEFDSNLQFCTCTQPIWLKVGDKSAKVWYKPDLNYFHVHCALHVVLHSLVHTRVLNKYQVTRCAITYLGSLTKTGYSGNNTFDLNFPHIRWRNGPWHTKVVGQFVPVITCKEQGGAWTNDDGQGLTK